MVTRAKRVLVAGGGPAGMKAAVTAAQRGHTVTLVEAGSRLGGQALLAQLLPDRAEFGGLITNLERELAQAGVDILLNTRVDAPYLKDFGADTVIIATGAIPYLPPVEGIETGHVVDAWDVLTGNATLGSNVLVADYRCDWVGMGIAEQLAKNGHHVTLAVNGLHAGQNLQMYLRDLWVARLHELAVEVIPYSRLFGLDGKTIYLSHIVSGKPIVVDGIDTVVVAGAHTPLTDLELSLGSGEIEIHLAGDCLAPRSAEEAIYEGLLSGRAV